MNNVEIYIGYTDRTWDTDLIDIPKDIPEEKVQDFIEQRAIISWTNSPPVHKEIAFVGMYNECPLSDLEGKEYLL